jgi:serine/threonine-protein kinase
MPPQQIGKYQVLSKIGQGAMGEVYKAHDPILDRYVAIKTIAGEMSSDEMLRTRFLREAQSAARLNHPNIIKVFDFGEEAGTLYMAMELLEGNDLKKAISQRAFTGLDEKLRVMEQIAEGLAFAHAHDVVHRDLKPANIHLQTGGQVKIMDFGLARLAGSEITRTGMVMGTPHYMSPEQVRGERADARSDVFAVGCVMYELLAYRKPFDADSMHSVLFKVLQEQPTPVRELVPDLPIVLFQVVEVALGKDPGQRFQDGRSFRDALAQARQAIARGEGDAPLRDLPVPGQVAGAVATDSLSAASVQRRVEGGGGRRPAGGAGGSRGGGVTAAPARPAESSRAPLFVGIGVGAAVLFLVLVLGAAKYLMSPTTPPPQGSQQVDRLAQEVVETQVQLAVMKLKAGDYTNAMRQAERALRLDPKNVRAQQVKNEARRIIAQLDAAVAETQSASAAADAERTRTALWQVIRLDPDNAVVDKVSAGQESEFRSQAEEARRLAADARSGAEKARATAPDGATLFADAEAAFKKERFVTAARRFVKAQAAYDRAQSAN